MNQRVEAAAKAEYEHEFLLLEGKWEDATPEIKECFRESVRAGVEAADVVMFSDEAVERAAEALCIKRYPMTRGFWAKVDPIFQQRCRDQARTVIAALKGDAWFGEEA